MKFGICADFRNPKKWYRPAPSLYNSLIDQVVLAEKLGFENCWLTEHHFTEDGYNPSLLAAASAIASRTETIRIGSFILLLPFISPLRAAEDISFVDILSNGRFDFGVGQGYSFHEFNGFCISRTERGARYKENLNVIKRLFTERSVTHEGKFSNFKEARLSPKPVQKPHPPIWVGARGPKAIQRAAEDGYNLIATFGKDPAPLYVETLKKCGRDPKDFRIGQLRMVYLADDEDQAWNEVQEHLFHAIDFYTDIVTDALDAEGDENYGVVKKPEEIRHSPLKDVVMVGSPSVVQKKMRHFVDNFDCTDLVVYMQFPGLDIAKANYSMELFAKHIMPMFD